MSYNVPELKKSVPLLYILTELCFLSTVFSSIMKVDIDFNISMALPNLERVIPPPPLPELRPFTPKDLENLFFGYS